MDVVWKNDLFNTIHESGIMQINNFSKHVVASTKSNRAMAASHFWGRF